MTVDPEREPVHGIGCQHGPLRPDWGPGWADLQCDVCQATWTGPIGEDCEYCHRWHELALETQRTVLLWPELPDPESDRYPPAIKAWAERLAQAVIAEIITQREAHKTWERNKPHVH